MGLIYYLGYYDTLENKSENRYYELAASNKMTYIISAIEKLGHTVEVISTSVTRNNRFYKGKVMPIGQRSRLRLFASWPYKPRVLRVLGRQVTRVQQFWYVLQNVKKDDTLIVYHSLALMRRVKWLKRICKFRLILEVEEFYGDVMEKKAVSEREQRFFQIADAYLFPAKRLNEKVNIENKPHILIYGTYQQEKDRACSFEEPEVQGKIHCAYAGTLDPRKGGGVMAAQAAKYLPENYHIHILGFGSDDEVKNMKSLVENLSKSCSCGISYDGCLKGEEYIRFLQSCHIGLSTQNPEGSYNDTSFPSKILSYMANGLQVVTVRIPVVEESEVGEWMCYYDDPSPEAIAQAIMNTTINDNCDGRAVIAELDIKFIKEIKALLEG